VIAKPKVREILTGHLTRSSEKPQFFCLANKLYKEKRAIFFYAWIEHNATLRNFWFANTPNDTSFVSKVRKSAGAYSDCPGMKRKVAFLPLISRNSGW